MMNVQLKVCSTCKSSIPIDDFVKDASKPDGRHGQCHDCRKRSKKTSREKTLYGVTPAWKPARYTYQKGLCDGCEQPFEINDLHIDHQHNTSILIARCLLCNTCNLDLGNVEKEQSKFRRLLNIAELYSHYPKLYPEAQGNEI